MDEEEIFTEKLEAILGSTKRRNRSTGRVSKSLCIFSFVQMERKIVDRAATLLQEGNDFQENLTASTSCISTISRHSEKTKSAQALTSGKHWFFTRVTDKL
jgi:hypothetical protein